MGKLTITLLLLISSATIADNLYMLMQGVQVVDIIEGKDLHSFSVDDIALLPAPCPANRLVFDADLPAADASLDMLLDAEYGDIELGELEYNYGDNGQCHLMRVEQQDLAVKPWSIEDLVPQETVWVDPQGIRRLVALGCPDPWDHPLHYDFMQFGASSGDTMRPFSGDMCISTRSHDLLDPSLSHFNSYWRICLGSKCTDYVKINWEE